MLPLSQQLRVTRAVWIHEESSQLPREVLRLMSGSSLERVFRATPRRSGLVSCGFQCSSLAACRIAAQSCRIARAAFPEFHRHTAREAFGSRDDFADRVAKSISQTEGPVREALLQAFNASTSAIAKSVTWMKSRARVPSSVL